MSSKNILLDNGLSLRDVMTTGSTFSIDHDFDDEEPLDTQYIRCATDFDILEINNSTPFVELSDMNTIDEQGFIKKKVLLVGGGPIMTEDCVITVEYAGYWEKEHKPFDHTGNHKPLTCSMSDSGLLPGIHSAILTMQAGEVSQFLFSYKVMYGERGVPPRIKPKADCMFIIKIISSCKEQVETQCEDRRSFQVLVKEAKTHFISGYNMYKANDLPGTIRIFKKASNLLLRSRLANEREQETQERLLKKIFYNMAICYNKLKLPLKACTCCNEYNRIESIYKRGNEKVLLQNAIALRFIGDFDRAEQKLRRALKLSPHDEAIQKEMELLAARREFYENSEKLIKQFASMEVSESFKDEVTKLLSEFFDDVDTVMIKLPDKLNDTELEYVRNKAQEYGFQMNNLLLSKEEIEISSSI